MIKLHRGDESRPFIKTAAKAESEDSAFPRFKSLREDIEKEKIKTQIYSPSGS